MGQTTEITYTLYEGPFGCVISPGHFQVTGISRDYDLFATNAYSVWCFISLSLSLSLSASNFLFYSITFPLMELSTHQVPTLLSLWHV